MLLGLLVWAENLHVVKHKSVRKAMGSINDGMPVLHDCTVSKFSFSE